MRLMRREAYPVRVLAVPLLAAGVVCGIAPGPASALGGRAADASRAAAVSFGGTLDGVTATSAQNAWAVGKDCPASGCRPLILRWDGTAWQRVPSPSPPGVFELFGVAATSARNAWAVGGTLIAHWNGTAWTRVRSPVPAGGSLDGVAATSARNAWAVGGTVSRALILRWNGTTWTRVRSPALAGGRLDGVAATSARNAWAVGGTLIVHWNGTAWTRVRSPVPAGGRLVGVAATSARNAWATGYNCPASGGGSCQPLTLRWNGIAWKRVRSPNPPSQPRGNWLFGVAATSARNAWAVGGTSITDASSGTFILRWNGTAWKRVPSPSPHGGPNLYAVAATSARNAWAVGAMTSPPPSNVVILHWNGTAWKRAA